MTIRVLVADDQSMVRAGFRMLLAGEDDFEVVAEASNGLEPVASLGYHVDVLLAGEEHAKAGADHRLIIGDENPDRHGS